MLAALLVSILLYGAACMYTGWHLRAAYPPKPYRLGPAPPRPPAQPRCPLCGRYLGRVHACPHPSARP